MMVAKNHRVYKLKIVRALLMPRKLKNENCNHYSIVSFWLSVNILFILKNKK